MYQHSTRRQLRLGLVGAVSAIALALTGCVGGGGDSATDGGSEADPIVLNFTSFAPAEENPHGLASVWFMDEVTERTNGRVTFNASFLEAACPAAETFQCVTDGRADVAFGVPTFEPQKFPITLIASVPFLAESNDQQVRAFQEFYATNEALEDEYAAQDLHMLGFWPSRVVMGGKGEPFLGPDDISGKDIRTTGGFNVTAISEIGGNPVAMTTNEVYEALQRGLVDAYTFPLEGILTYSLSDHTEFIVDPNGFNSIQTFVMNDTVYESLDDEAKTVIDEVAAELPSYAIDLIAERVVESCTKFIEETDVEEFVSWSQAESADWAREVSSTLRADWETTAAESGVADPAAIFDEWLAALDGVTDVVPDAELDCAETFRDAS